MGFSKRISYFLVHRLNISGKQAQELIFSEKVTVQGKTISSNCHVDDHSEITVNGKVIREKKELVYLKFHKPAGFESTLNPDVPDNLSAFFRNFSGLAIAGRLDKASEGLLLLSNDGKWIENLCHPKFEKEKEYEVELDRTPAEDFLEAFRTGIRMGAIVSRPCFCIRSGVKSINVILKEGKNRQIRRMCHNQGYQVKQLTRLRIHQYMLNNLSPGGYSLFQPH